LFCPGDKLTLHFPFSQPSKALQCKILVGLVITFGIALCAFALLGLVVAIVDFDGFLIATLGFVEVSFKN